MASSRVARRRPLRLHACLAMLLATSCATGTGVGIGDDYEPLPTDARVSDGVPAIDATDAPVSFPDATDAPIGLPDTPGGTCTMHSECGTGMCCFGMSMCIPGMAVPGFPPPFDCLPA